jgi:flagellar motor protein MotB
LQSIPADEDTRTQIAAAPCFPLWRARAKNFTLTKDDMPKLKDQLEQKIRQMNDFEKLKSHVEITVTTEGLRIKLMESGSGTFFDSGSPRL